MSYKYFLFDWDGSLADTLPIWFAGHKKIFAQEGITVTTEMIANDVMGDPDGPKKLGITNSEKFYKDLEDEVIEKINSVKLNPGVLKLLKKIKMEGGKIGIITASRKRWVKTALRNNGLRDLVDVFLGKEDVEFVKPDPEAIFKALKLMQGKPEETVMVGDNGKDIMAGRRAGVRTGLYFPDRYQEYYGKDGQTNFGPAFVFKDFAEVEKFL